MVNRSDLFLAGPVIQSKIARHREDLGLTAFRQRIRQTPKGFLRVRRRLRHGSPTQQPTQYLIEEC